MEGRGNSPEAERTVPVQILRGSRAFKQFKNPPQPHMCIQDTIKNTTEKLYINVLGWQKIANTLQNTDPIPLYGGMQVSRTCGPKAGNAPSIVFAVMVNPEILKINGKNAENPSERDYLVSLLCDFVEEKNPGLQLSHKPVILKDRDLAGELKDVWLAVTERREREKYSAQEITHKIYQIDVPPEQFSNDNSVFDTKNRILEPKFESHQDNSNDEVVSKAQNGITNNTRSPNQLHRSAGEKSYVDTGRCPVSVDNQLDSQPPDGTPYSAKSSDREMSTNIAVGPRTNFTSTQGFDQMSNGQTSTVCTPVYGHIMSTRENYRHAGENHKHYIDGAIVEAGWEVDSPAQNGNRHKTKNCSPVQPASGTKKEQYDFFPVFETNPTVNSHTQPLKTVETPKEIPKEGDGAKAIENVVHGDTKNSHIQSNSLPDVACEDKINLVLDSMEKISIDPITTTNAIPGSIREAQ